MSSSFRTRVRSAVRSGPADAFGAHIDGLRALVLGLVPDCRLQAVTSVGHAAGHGAWIVLVNAAARVDIQGVVRRIEMSHRHHP